MVFDIKSVAASEVPFSPSMRNCSTSAGSCLELKLNGAWQDYEMLGVWAHKKFHESTGLLDVDFIFYFHV